MVTLRPVAQHRLAVVDIVCARGVQSSENCCADTWLRGVSGRERSAENESGGPGNFLDGDCWTLIAC